MPSPASYVSRAENQCGSNVRREGGLRDNAWMQPDDERLLGNHLICERDRSLNLAYLQVFWSMRFVEAVQASDHG